MRFSATTLNGAFVIELQKQEDDRGFFARAFCRDEFSEQGLVSDFVQINDSLSVTKGTLRGLHYQLPPAAEVKLVRCIRGALYDIVLDLRSDSPTFGQSVGVELTADSGRMMYVPRGCAHGFVTLEPHTEALYLVDEVYSPELERGVRWNDPAFNIQWPIEPVVISTKDQSHRDFDRAYHLTT